MFVVAETSDSKNPELYNWNCWHGNGNIVDIWVPACISGQGPNYPLIGPFEI